MNHAQQNLDRLGRLSSRFRSEAGPAADDLDLMRRIEDGSTDAMNELLSRYWPAVVEYVARYTDGPDEAEDIAQEVFLRLWQKRIVWKNDGSLRSFLFGVGRNLARNQGRRWREVRLEALDGFGDPRLGVAGSPAEGAEEAELEAHFRRAVARLPQRRQEVFILARLHGLSYQEIAGVMEISAQTVANQMSSALAELRRELGPLLRQ